MTLLKIDITAERVFELLTISKKTQNEIKNDPKFEFIARKINSNKLNFSNIEYKKINKRVIARYDTPPKPGKPKKYTAENVALLHLKTELNKLYHVNFNNRNKIIERLFDSLQIARNLNDFTIIKFDFKKFFYTISTKYVYDRYIDDSRLARHDKDLFISYCAKVPYCVAGIPINNYLVEIISKDFDKKVQSLFARKGLVFYERYVDDGIIILNRFTSEDESLNIIQNAINDIFYPIQNKNKVRLSKNKFQIIHRRNLLNSNRLDFLGYDFHFDNEFKNFTVGITQRKIDKYQTKVNKLIKEYYNPADKQARELTRQIIKINSSRIVYCSGSRNKKNIWVSKGIIANYNMLRNYTNILDLKTMAFMNDVYINAFDAINVTPPQYLKSPRYSLYNNLKMNKAMIFHEQIGMSRKRLLEELNKIRPAIDKSEDSYDKILRYYLIDGVRAGY